ncbi:hypothetical protein V5799_021436, partial [Amblyomma americanum]
HLTSTKEEGKVSFIQGPSAGSAPPYYGKTVNTGSKQEGDYVEHSVLARTSECM